MFSYELLAVVYFSGLLAVTIASEWAGRTTVVAASAAAIATVILASWLAPTGLREWLPHVYLASGYWVPGLMVAASRPEAAGGTTRFERWLVGTDQTIRPRLPALPASLVTLTELAYLMCYPIVPISFAVVWFEGTPADVSRFWLSVLGAGYACYVSLPWLLSRPPRTRVDAAPQAHRVRAWNVFVLSRMSHEWNTFPSGHVAVCLAAALSVARVSAPAGVAIGVAAAAVAVGAAAGRYHYVVDVTAGILIGAVAAMITW
jgi:membrane-associated phospholipid phosphatase